MRTLLTVVEPHKKCTFFKDTHSVTTLFFLTTATTQSQNRFSEMNAAQQSKKNI